MEPTALPTSHRIIYFLPLLLLLPLAIYAVIPPSAPHTPLGNAEAPAIVRQSLAKSDTSSLAYYLAGSEKYLSEARSISQQTKNNQTEDDKKKIIALLNSSLKMANNAVNYYPNNPESFNQRARLLEVLSVIDPSAKSQAEADRSLASRLTGNQTSSPTPINPVDLVKAAPLEQASLLSQAVIALPQDGQAATETRETTNALRGQVTLQSGSTDVTVHSLAIRDDKLVYYTPEGDPSNEILSLTSKSEAKDEFTLHLSGPLDHDLVIDWLIVD